jgi:hypothetical protein
MRQGIIWGLLATGLVGCDVLKDIADGVEPPEAALNRVDLIHAPEVEELVAWQCIDAFGVDSLSPCTLSGLDNKPKTKDLTYSFDLVFDLSNPNKSLPIPLVEALLGMNVYDDQNLGAVCVSFCDPDQEDCAPARDAEGACRADEADAVKSPEDLIPSVDDLVGITEGVLEDGFDNGDWRWIDGGQDVEAHIRFDLFADVMLGLSEEILTDALNDVLAGQKVKVEVPYAADGTVFFDVPELGRKGIGFGPTENTWVLK